jgi:hypothetical protein
MMKQGDEGCASLPLAMGATTNATHIVPELRGAFSAAFVGGNVAMSGWGSA